MRPITLNSILSTGRPYGGRMESHLRSSIQKRFGGTVDSAGNLQIIVGDPKTHSSLFAAHLDTAHRTDGYVGFRQKNGVYSALKECLGADDGAGIWILLQMLTNAIPGTYVFTVGEEAGAIGASMYTVPPGISRCIEFDRRGTTDIIYEQCGAPTASKEAALWLCNALQMKHKPSPHGLFTDNAVWAWEIPECLNVSVGYDHEHSVMETLDYGYLLELCAAVLGVDWESMPTHRTPMDYSRQSWVNDNFRFTTEDITECVRRNPEKAAELLHRHMDPEELFYNFLSIMY